MISGAPDPAAVVLDQIRQFRETAAPLERRISRLQDVSLVFLALATAQLCAMVAGLIGRGWMAGGVFVCLSVAGFASWQMGAPMKRLAAAVHALADDPNSGGYDPLHDKHER